MSLTNRLLLFFMTTLAAVLATFSLALYLLARSHLHALVEGQLDAALDTLVAAAEIHPEGVEWDTAERLVGFRAESIVWRVSDPSGKIVDRSPEPLAPDAEAELDEFVTLDQIGRAHV